MRSASGSWSTTARMLLCQLLRSHWIEVVALPWPKVDASLKAIASKAPAHVRPGQPVTVKVDVDAVRFGNAEEVRKALTQTLTERLAAEGIPVANGQSVVLHARYGEAAGKTLNEMQGGGPLPGFGGTPTGRTVQATKAGCEIAWEVPGLGSVWSDRIDFDPSNLMVRGEATDAKAREAAFGALRHSLNGLAIPYFIPKGGGLATLPGVTVISSDAAPPTANRASVKKTTRGQARELPRVRPCYDTLATIQPGGPRRGCRGRRRCPTCDSATPGGSRARSRASASSGSTGRARPRTRSTGRRSSSWGRRSPPSASTRRRSSWRSGAASRRASPSGSTSARSARASPPSEH